MLYKSSKGEVEISTMPLSYAKNALNKLRRTEPERTDEIDALDTHVTRLETEATEKALNPPVRDGAAPIGDNNPPAEDPEPATPITGRAAIAVHVADLLAQTQGCCLVVENDDQAAVVSRLHRQLQEAAALVDATAANEKKPHNDALAEIGTWQNGFTAKGLKKTPDGSLTKALLATSNLSSAWLRKQDDDRKAREAEATKAALAAAQVAVVAREEAKVSTDTEVMDNAENALAQAQALLAQAVGVSRERVRSGGGDGYRAMGLRSVYTAKIKDEPGSWDLAYSHYKQNPEFMAEFHALIQRWADRDARTEATRVLGVPGFNFIEDRIAA